jgi:hypothetical protein
MESQVAERVGVLRGELDAEFCRHDLGQAAGGHGARVACPAGTDDGQLAADDRPPEVVADPLDDGPLGER